MPRSHLTQTTKSKLDRIRFLKSIARRSYIEANIDKLAREVENNAYARNVVINRRNGSINFQYCGRRVQYWLGTNTMTVRNPVTITRYHDFQPEHFREELTATNPKDAFKLKETYIG